METRDRKLNHAAACQCEEAYSSCRCKSNSLHLNFPADLLPCGTYSAELTNVFRYRTEGRPRVGLEFTLSDPKSENVKIIQSSAINYNPKSRLTSSLNALNHGKRIDVSKVRTLVGTKCSALVTQGKSRKGDTLNYIDKVFPIVDC